MDILIPEELATPAFDALRAKYSVVYEGGLWRTPDELMRTAREARALLVRNQTQVTSELLLSARQLVAVGRLGVGLDNIDLESATENGVVVIAPLDANATSVAELAVSLMIALARKIPAADRSTKSGAWDRKGCMGLEVAGKTLAICGFGRIGKMVAARARAFEMRLRVYDPLLTADAPVFKEGQLQFCDTLEEALRHADFVSVHAPLTPNTKQLFNAERFAMMKRGSFFVNTSRGGLVDESALLEALRKGHLAGAALDVRDVEPPDRRLGFEDLDGVILTPHIGAATVEAQTRTFETVAADIDRILCGEAAVNYVNFARPKRDS